MPKTIITEHDNTTAAFSSTGTFAVVVPGKYNTEQADLPFDENGIYECTSVKDFVNKIGKISAEDKSEAIPATCVLLSDAYGDTAYIENTSNTLTAEEFYVTYAGNIYTRSVISDTAEQKVGKLVNQLASQETPDAPKWFKYTKLTSDDTWNADTLYSVILPANIGADYSEGSYQVGNQMAYLLLTLGYPVLYLGINDTSRKINDINTWEPLKDRMLYDYRYLTTGMLADYNNITVDEVNKIITTIATQVNTIGNVTSTGRGDVIALLDISKDVYSGLTSAQAVNAIINHNVSYATRSTGIFVPTVIYENITDSVYQNAEMPASFHYLACAAQAMQQYPEYYGICGYTRGISALKVAGTTVKFGDAAMEAFQPRTNETGLNAAINPIIKLKNNYYLWGNRTGHALNDTDLVASHYLNIRQLCCTLNKEMYTITKHLLYSPNTDILWLNFCNALRPTLDTMKANEGIKDYQFVKLSTDKKGKLFAAVRIIPIEAVEDFELGITLESNFDSVTIDIDETF